ncbi:hypothetical protein TNCT_622501 [Trichonephila clavata]|uniref:rRNA biogenesis protein RRP36 n=1 Tax=Trichonephila clavata TaxID=2740835 RepID=A0A8X6M0M6_TRICU|nr:hypothetical protein TNCT_622501 [Trichonephila clavata]
MGKSVNLHHRDPRFDDLSGRYNAKMFEENYEFIKDIKEREKKELEKELEHVGENEKTKKKKTNVSPAKDGKSRKE